jgi:uncharacterized protein (TIGR02266 family)
MEDDKRLFPRVPLVVKVTNALTKEFHYFYSSDISQGGIFLETRQPYDRGAEVELDFVVPLRESKKRMVVAGKVARVVDPVLPNHKNKDKITPGMGIKFDDITVEAVSVISAYVRQILTVEEEIA